jgi:hypothetical protein
MKLLLDLAPTCNRFGTGLRAEQFLPSAAHNNNLFALFWAENPVKQH